MFTAEQSDPHVIAGALTGSMTFGSGDRWSDIDVAFGIAEGVTPEAVLDDWTAVLTREWGVLDHFDLPFGSSIYRVFLLPSGQQVDVAATPAKDFGARGPQFRALFGPTQHVPATPQPSASFLIGLSWLYILHARSSIERHTALFTESKACGILGLPLCVCRWEKHALEIDDRCSINRFDRPHM